MLSWNLSESLSAVGTLGELMPHELLVLNHLNPMAAISADRLRQLVEEASGRTARLSLALDDKLLQDYERENPLFLSELQKKGLRYLHLKMDLDVPSYNYLGLNHQSPYLLQCRDRLSRILERHPQMELVPLLSIPASQIHHLGPLIAMMAVTPCRELWLIPPPRRTEAAVKAYRDLFEYIRLRGVENLWLPFSPLSPQDQVWNMQTYNSFAGPHSIHFDISNKCTHSCNFCGLYSNEALAKVKQLPAPTKAEVHQMLASSLDFTKGREILKSLPGSVRFIQFGGVGDPMTHPHFMDFLRLARERGIDCEILSNMDYFDEAKILEVTRLGGRRWSSLHFIANVSGASEKTYLQTRPRQSARNYRNVMHTLDRLREEREKNEGHGAHLTLMCVLNKTNYREAPAYVRMAAEKGAHQVYLKAMEIHIDFQASLLIPDEKKMDYAHHIREALRIADEIGMPLVDRAALEKICTQFPSALSQQNEKSLLGRIGSLWQ